jgi:hypothetical protein
MIRGSGIIMFLSFFNCLWEFDNPNPGCDFRSDPKHIFSEFGSDEAGLGGCSYSKDHTLKR